jgi:hypothetical protein
MTLRRMKIKIFWVFIFIFGFSTQFFNTILKASPLCSAKVLNQEHSKFANPILHGVNNLFSSLQML